MFKTQRNHKKTKKKQRSEKWKKNVENKFQKTLGGVAVDLHRSK